MKQYLENSPPRRGGREANGVGYFPQFYFVIPERFYRESIFLFFRICARYN